MLGKIFTVCMLVSLSACLVRPQPTGKEQFAGIADDVAAVLSKWGAKSTDEAVAKIWAKGSNSNRTDIDDLAKLLNSSNGHAVLAALQQPVKSKLAKLDGMVAEYLKGEKAPAHFYKRMLIDMDETVDEINAALINYSSIVNKIADNQISNLVQTKFRSGTFEPGIRVIDYPARRILEMAKVPGIKTINLEAQYTLSLAGNSIERLQVWVFMRNFKEAQHQASKLIREGLSEDEVLVLRKYFSEGSLEDDIYPLYNQFAKWDNDGNDFLKISHKLRGIDKDFNSVWIYLDNLVYGLPMRVKLLDMAGISAARRAEIETGSLRFLKGAGENGEETLEKIGLSGWSKEMQKFMKGKGSNIYKEYKKSISKQGEQKMLISKSVIMQRLKEIEQMK